MKKILITSLISILGTTAIAGGTIYALTKMPNKLNISWGKQEQVTDTKDKETIAELNKELSEKDKIIANKDELIEEKNQTIDLLNNYNNSANEIISSLQLEVEELENMLNSGSSRISIPIDIVLHGVKSFAISENEIYVSSHKSTGTKGLIYINKQTGEVKKVFDSGFNYTSCYILSNGNLLFASDTNSGRCLVYINIKDHSVLYSDTSFTCTGSVYMFESETKIAIGSSNGSSHLCVIDKITSEAYKTSDQVNGLIIANNNVYYASKNSFKKLDLETKEKTTIISDFGTIPMLINISNDEVLLCSTSSSVKKIVKYTISTNAQTTISDSIYFNLGATQKVQLKENCYLLAENYIYDSVNSTLTKTTGASGKLLTIKDNIAYLVGSTYVYYLDLETFTGGSIGSITNLKPNDFILLSNGNYVCSYNTSLYYLDLEAKTLTSYSTNLSLEYTKIEDLGDGKYKLIDKTETSAVVLDTIAKQLQIIEIMF